MVSYVITCNHLYFTDYTERSMWPQKDPQVSNFKIWREIQATAILCNKGGLCVVSKFLEIHPDLAAIPKRSTILRQQATILWCQKPVSANEQVGPWYKN